MGFDQVTRSLAAAGLILAGGGATRMGGGDKTLLSLDGKAMLAHILERIEPQLAEIAISANGDPERFSAFAKPVLVDDDQHDLAGPLAGILSGIRWANGLSPAKRLLTVAGDTPFLPDNLAVKLMTAVAGHPRRIAVAASAGRRHPVVALWPVELASDLGHFMADRSSLSIARFLEGQDTVTVDFPLVAMSAGDIDPFFNVNSPEDLAQAETLMRRHP